MRSGLVVLVLIAACADNFNGPCGNGALDPFEECDDGNIESGDLCSQNCLREPSCGDSYIDFGENCDDGNTVPGDNCDENCRTETVCGDNDIEPGETCEDGNADPSDGCSAACQIEYRVATKVTWKFVVAADTGPDRGCPAGFDTVEITTQALNDDDSIVHAAVVERVPCVDGSQLFQRYQGRYRVRVRITDTTGVPTYAAPVESTVLLRIAQRDVFALFIHDGGYARVAWRVVDPATQQLVSCADGGVSEVGVLAASPGFSRTVFALCITGQVTSPPLQAGEYTMTLVGYGDFGEELGTTSMPITITAPNGVLDVGTLDLPSEP